MKKIVVLLFATVLGSSMAVHSADSDTREAAKQEQVKKLRAQAANAHRRGDAFAAQAEKLETEAGMNPGEKLRGGLGDKAEKRLIGGQCTSDGRVGCSIVGK